VLGGGDVDINIMVMSPSGRILMDEQTISEINRELEIHEDGPYKVCFDNTFSFYSDKVVYFDLGIDLHNGTAVDHEELFRGLDLAKDDYENTKEIVVGFLLLCFTKIYGSN